jgi:hypothetical protein
MGEGIPDYTGVFRMYGGGVSYTARAIRCGDHLVVRIADEFIRNQGLREGDWVTAHLNYVGSLDERMMHLRGILPEPLRRLADEQGGEIPDVLLLPSVYRSDLEKWIQWLPEQIREEARRRKELPKSLAMMKDGSVRAIWRCGPDMMNSHLAEA